MSKEQLEELIIKRNENRGLNKFEVDWVVKYAKEQSERVDKLEQQNKRYHDFIVELYNASYGLQLYPHLVDSIKKLLEEVE